MDNKNKTSNKHRQFVSKSPSQLHKYFHCRRHILAKVFPLNYRHLLLGLRQPFICATLQNPPHHVADLKPWVFIFFAEANVYTSSSLSDKNKPFCTQPQRETLDYSLYASEKNTPFCLFAFSSNSKKILFDILKWMVKK